MAEEKENLKKDDNIEDVSLKKKEEGKGITVYYVTDPICCFSWFFEPEIRKFNMLYKDSVDFKVVMGGLMKSFEELKKEVPEFKEPKDIGEHCKEESGNYGMPLDGTVWAKDPLSSSYPPSKAIKLVGEISKSSSEKILRMMREEMMVFNRNISKDSVMEDILNRQNRNGAKIIADIKEGKADALFDADLKFAEELGADVFPTVVIADSEGNGIRIKDFTDFETMEKALYEVAGEEIEPAPLPSFDSLFDYSRNLFFKEIEVMYDIEPEMVEDFISKNMPENSYEIREILGTKFVIRK